MALIPNNDIDIVMELTDYVAGATVVKRKAQLLDLTYSPVRKVVTISLAIYPYQANEDGSYGPAIVNDPMFKTEYETLTADNSSLVDAQTGEIVKINTYPGDPALEGIFDDAVDAVAATYDEDGNELTPAIEAKPAGELFGRDVMFEFDFYKMVAAGVPVVIDQLIINKIQQANAAGRI